MRKVKFKDLKVGDIIRENFYGIAATSVVVSIMEAEMILKDVNGFTWNISRNEFDNSAVGTVVLTKAHKILYF
jgi:hypothetical protein